jgi:hypothetical protein|tara:strand:- start:1915 stop:2175 length:261 start_codon:yes stop_codon:yes gene_type:complete
MPKTITITINARRQGSQARREVEAYALLPDGSREPVRAVLMTPVEANVHERLHRLRERVDAKLKEAVRKSAEDIAADLRYRYRYRR